MVTPGLAAVAFSRLMLDVFSMPKVLVIAVAACALAGVGGTAVLRGHRLTRPPAAPLRGALAFVAVACAATVFSPTPLRSFVGASGARAGLLLYLGCAVIFVAAAMLYRTQSPVQVVKALLLTAIPVAAYAALQAVNLDPLSWRTNAGGPLIFATFGNANFFSAWTGVVVVLAVWGGVSATWSTRWRIACDVFALVLFGLTLASQSIQGPLAAVAGVGVFAAARVSERGRHAGTLRRRTLLFVGLPLVAGGAAAVIMATRGDAAGSVATRLGKWQAAIAMGRARPFTGFGFDLFSDWYHAYRPVEDAIDRGLAHTADAAHSVPLQFLAGGGLPLVIGYGFFVAAVAVVALRELRRAHGERRLLLGALIGAWAAYHVQAAVSIDVPPLAVLHWLLAGLLVAVAAGPPAAPAPHPAHRPWLLRHALAATLAGCLVLGMFTVPVRSEVAARRGIRLALQERHASSERSFSIALRLSPWESRYPLALARERLHRGDGRLALDAYTLAAAREPRGMIIALERARAAHEVGRHDEAIERYDLALQLDPGSPHLMAEAARHHLHRGDPRAAVRLLERAIGTDDRQRWRRMLRRARVATEERGSASVTPGLRRR